jgi:hypothetical protein
MQLNVCNGNIHGLKRTYANVANRGEVTKEVVENAVTLGVISFNERGVLLNYQKKAIKTEYHIRTILF